MAQLDVFRDRRKGIPEVIYGKGKPAGSLHVIAKKVLSRRPLVIVSRVTDEQVAAIRGALGKLYDIRVSEQSPTVVISRRGYTIPRTGGRVGIITAGTSDIPVADEARVVAEAMGCTVYPVFDVGVAGIHRLFPQLKMMVEKDVDVIIVVAGMEGALPGVVTGLVDLPVVGVPVSTGYGYGGQGKGALTTMLQSCALGLAVVNIDNGIAAGATAALIANRAKR
ncbi:MAG: nickel pincer cofactor biosynthesis protein LarB [Candidatus Ranarchaeia archaeon]